MLADGGVSLRPLCADDWDAFYGVARDPAIWALHPFHDRWQEPVCRRFFDDGLVSGGGMAILDGTGVLIGSSRYVEAADGQSVEIGWTFLARAHWGGATNRLVKRLMIGHALGQVPRVTFRVGATNLRSRRALEKVGAQLTDRVDWTEVHGAPVEHVIYVIDRAAFAHGPLA